MLILAGLGNPGPAYAGNRHNLGAITVEAIADHWRFSGRRRGFSGFTREGAIETAAGAKRVLTLFPQTYYNESGRAVAGAMRFFKLEPADVVVFYDEIDLAPGRFRMKRGGGAAGNNGIRSIAAAIGADFRRARLGTGHPGDKALVLGHVLSDFSKVERDWVSALIEACARAAPLLVAGEDERYQAEVLRLAPAPKLDPRRMTRERP